MSLCGLWVKSLSSADGSCCRIAWVGTGRRNDKVRGVQ